MIGGGGVRALFVFSGRLSNAELFTLAILTGFKLCSYHSTYFHIFTLYRVPERVQKKG